jgi:uncharacterized protein (TIGR02145 family)
MKHDSKTYRVMKRGYISKLILLTMFVAFFACDKEEKITLPSVDTASVDEIYNTTARVGGRVSNNGGAEIIDRGVYWGTSASPETSGTKLQIGSGDGAYYETLSGLTSGLKYYVKAYASNSMGISYGDETFFTTQINLPTVETSPVTTYTSTTAKIGGNVIDNGGFETTKRGVHWGTEPNPRLTGTKLELGSGDGDFSETVTDLSRSYTYYVIAYATNIKGTAYGEEIIFSTEPELATVYTKIISGITAYSARIGGTISSNGGTGITESGVYWGTSEDPVSTGAKLINGSGTGDFVNTIDNLNPGVKYYVMAYAINSIGTSFGELKSFTTLGKAPTVRILDYTNLTSSGITLNGVVSARDLNTTVTFQYVKDSNTDTTYVVYGSPVTENDDTITVNITGLNSLTTYHFRIKTENDLGSVYSAYLTVKTVITGFQGTVQDIEGNTYQTIGIGYQQWMTENLKAVKYSNGTKIPSINNDSIWAQLTGAGFCWYAKDSVASYNTYGALYNWYAVNNGQLCPTDWHVPTNEDITQMVNYIGGAGEAGGLLKETGTVHWNSPNTGATNKYSFTARAGGKRLADGIFDFVKVEGNWWSSTEYSTLNGSNLTMLFNYSNSFQAYSNKKIGMSIRCIMD